MTDLQIDAYLERIGLAAAPAIDLDGLASLQHAHMTHVPFEALDVYDGLPVRTDTAWSIPKIVDRRRGGWCFELNGSFGALLAGVGFDVSYLGAAVLLDGPNATIDHLMLEVALDRSYLVDVGFGKSFVQPLDINRAGPQTDPAGVFEFIDSSQGRTLTWHDDEGVPVPQYRFRRVTLELDQFTPASEALQSDRSLQWSAKPFATRLLGNGADRITLLRDRLEIERDGQSEETPVAEADWNAVLAEHFGITRTQI